MTNNVTNMGSASTVSNSGHLEDYEFLPGVIVETDDPLRYGRVKVSALGAYNANNSSSKQLPWCYPFMMIGNNSYASYEKGSKVWILRNKKRQDENWFWPMYEQHAMTQSFVDGKNPEDKPEVISMRNNGGSQSSITYDHKGGYNISTGGNGGGASLNIGTSSSASMTGGSSSVSANNDGINLGTPGEDPHPAVLGDKLSSFILDMFNMLIKFCETLSAEDPMAKNATLLMSEWLIEKLSGTEIEDMLSKKVMINETTAADAAAKEKAKAEEEATKEKTKTEVTVQENKEKNYKSAQEKLSKGQKMTKDEYDSLTPFEQNMYRNNKLMEGTIYSTAAQNQFLQDMKQIGQSRQSQHGQQTQQNQTYRQQNIAVSDNTSMYNRTTPPSIETRTYSIPTSNNQIPIGGSYDPNNAVFRQG